MKTTHFICHLRQLIISKEKAWCSYATLLAPLTKKSCIKSSLHSYKEVRNIAVPKKVFETRDWNILLTGSSLSCPKTKSNDLWGQMLCTVLNINKRLLFKTCNFQLENYSFANKKIWGTRSTFTVRRLFIVVSNSRKRASRFNQLSKMIKFRLKKKG